jgi:hypothetical protein
MITIESLKDKIRELLIEKDGNLLSNDLKYIVDEAKKLSLDDKYIANLVPDIDRTINWEQIKTQKEEQFLRKRQFEQETRKKEEEIRAAPDYLDALVKYCISDGIVEPSELLIIFKKADELKQDSSALAIKISTLFEINKFRPYPSPDITTSSLIETLCSTHWYNEIQYNVLITPPEQPSKIVKKTSNNFNKIKITASITLSIFIGIILYVFIYIPWEKDKDAPRYYTIASDATLRSSPIARAEYNKVMTLPYGTEVITYKNNSDWVYGKVGDKEGYVSSSLVVSKNDFYLLSSVFGDSESMKIIATIKCRKALINYYKNKKYIGNMSPEIQKEIYGHERSMSDVWQVFSKGKDIKTNTVYYSRIYDQNSKYTDFAVLIKNISNNKRIVLIFAFKDDEEPILKYEQDAPTDGDIVSIYKVKQNGSDFIRVNYSKI